MTDRLAFHTLDVFTDRRYGGNPLAVVLAADGLNTRQMQTMAREFNLSETVFVQAANHAQAQFKVRIFTPDVELPFAGHPTVGTACLLAELGLAPQGVDVRFVLEENVGLVPVRVVREAGRPLFGALTTAVLPAWSPNGAADVPSNAVLAEMLGLAADDIGANGPGYDESPRACSCGVPYVLVPLRAPELLAGITFSVERWRSALAEAWAHHVYVYARGYDGELRARMFAPGSGVVEDPATGSAAVALAGRLGLESPVTDGTLRWSIHQGLEMGRPSLLLIEVDKASGAVTAVRVGGHAVRMLDGTIPV